MRRSRGRLMGAAVVATLALLSGRASGGSLDPTNAPGPTMRTLDEIHQKLEIFTPTRNLSITSVTIQAGYYAATNLAQADTNLTAANIKTNITVFGITGSHVGGGLVYTNSRMAVAKTGQLQIYQSGDDGSYQFGYPWPNPRFTTGSGVAQNCVVDNATGLMWVKNPSADRRDWAGALAYCEGLNGADGRGGYTDWRLPNVLEMQSLIDYSSTPALPTINPFTGVALSGFWTSTTTKFSQYFAWIVDIPSGAVNGLDKTTNYCAWPVRGGP